MSELNLNGQPIFVDVDTDNTFPILYTRLLQSDQNENASEDVQTMSVKSETRGQITAETNQNAAEISENATEPTANSNNNNMKPEPVSNVKTPKRLRCSECKRYTTDNEEKMIRHMRLHRGENPFQCFMCDYSTYNKAVFEEHVRIHKGIKPFKCSKCDYRSASKKNTKKHELIHRPDNPLRCKSCEFIARNNKVLQHHITKEHSNDLSPSVECKTCNAQFKTKDKLKMHLRNQNKCKSCTDVSCTTKSFMKHIASAHPNQKRTTKVRKQPIRLFHCQLCTWNSNSKPRILLHLIHHPNQKVNEDLIDITVLRVHGIME